MGVHGVEGVEEMEMGVDEPVGVEGKVESCLFEEDEGVVGVLGCSSIVELVVA